MDLSEVYDNKLTIIKQYHDYLKDVIRKGYNNSIDMLILIDKHINNFLNEAHKLVEDKKIIIDKPNTQSLDESLEDTYNDDTFLYSSSSDSDSDNDSKELEQNKRELNKIDNFINNSNDLSKLYIYNINNKNNYINKMKKFISNNNY